MSPLPPKLPCFVVVVFLYPLLSVLGDENVASGSGEESSKRVGKNWDMVAQRRKPFGEKVMEEEDGAAGR